MRDKGKHSINHLLSTLYNPIKFLIRNTKGANIPYFKNHCDTLIKAHSPALVALLETKMLDHKNITELFHFDSYLESSVVERKGSIVVIWKEKALHL